jgi:tetratricopeptide (TPR) repeat protein/tRNA A-37 threonylcarbamoyl transferase component Bud32
VTPEQHLAPEDTAGRQPGTRVGRYVLGRVIGSGAMGTVWAATDPELDRPVAIKILHADATRGRARRSLLREAQATARLNHRNVVTIHDVGIADDRLFVAMELVDGSTLRAWLEHPHRWQEIVAVLREAGAGLVAAHDAGIVHRDFKPDNVLIDARAGGPVGRVVVTDFGLAVTLDESLDDDVDDATHADIMESDDDVPIARAHEVTQKGPVPGTISYAAPEQRGGGRVDARSDQFSFCVTLHEALWGERRVACGRCVPAWLRRVVMRGLAPAPGDRFPDMRALLAALDPWRRRRAASWIIGLTTGVSALAIAIASRHSEPVHVSYCDRVEAQLDGIWDAETRGEIESAFLATREPSAADAWGAVSARVDAFASAWVDAQTQACAAQADGSVPSDVLALRMTCLERQLGRAAAVSEALRVVDRDAVLRSSESVAHLDSPAICVDDEQLSHRARVRADVDPHVQLELDGMLSRAEALAHIAKYDESEAIARTVLERARAVGDRWAVVDALLEIAIAHQWRHEPAAEQAYHDALSAALAVNHRRATALAVIGLVELWDANAVDGVERAERWVRHGEATISALGGDTALEIELGVAMANVYLKNGRYDDAEAAYQRTLALRRDSKDDILLAGAHANLGAIAAARGRFGEALVGFRRSHDLIVGVYGLRHPNVANAAVNVGSALAELGDLDSASVEHRRALEIFEENFGPEHGSLAPALRMLAWNALSRRAFAEALPYAERALAIARRDSGEGDESTARSLSMVAAIELELGRVDEARTKSEAALAIARAAFGPQHPTLAEFEIECGLVATRADDEGAARKHFTRAIELRERELGPHDAEVGRAWTGIAELEMQLGRSSAAIAAASRAYDIASTPGNDRGIGRPDAAFLLARALAAAGQRTRAGRGSHPRFRGGGARVARPQ